LRAERCRIEALVGVDATRRRDPRTHTTHDYFNHNPSMAIDKLMMLSGAGTVRRSMRIRGRLTHRWDIPWLTD